MTIETVDQKLALMEDMPWTPGIPIDEDIPFETGEKLQLLWEYPFAIIPGTIVVIDDELRRRTGDEDERLRRNDMADELRRNVAALAGTTARRNDGSYERRRRAQDED